MTQKEKPFIITLDDQADRPHPAEIDAPETEIYAPSPSRPKHSGIWGWIGILVFSLIAGMISIWFWDFAQGLIQRNVLLGWIFSALALAVALGVVIALIIEITAMRRLKNIDALKHAARIARQTNDIKSTERCIQKLTALYQGRPDLTPLVRELNTIISDEPDAFSKLNAVETHVLRLLDAQASHEIETAARQVATVTALMPIAAVDVVSAMIINVRMIRKIGQIYGGRAGVLSSIALLRKVTSHLVATGALAIGDDWLGSVFGGSLMAKLSRRFGEGMINATLTARVGKSAVEACRPLDFHHNSAPKLRSIMGRALAGVFDKNTD